MRLPWFLCAALLLSGCLAPPAGAQTPLAPAQFAAIDAIYTSQLALERKISSENFANARTACRGLDSGDPLLNRFRRDCSASLAVAKSLDAFADCKTALGCLRTARAARIELTGFLSSLRTLNRAIDAAMLVPACRGELRASKSDLRFFERTRDFLRLFQEVAITGSPVLERRLDREAAALDKLADDQPSSARELKRFRAACAPTT